MPDGYEQAERRQIREDRLLRQNNERHIRTGMDGLVPFLWALIALFFAAITWAIVLSALGHLS